MAGREHVRECRPTVRGGRTNVSVSRKSRGFTLGELATTLAVAGCLGAVGYPAVSNVYMNLRIRTLAAEFAADLRYARAEAISRRTTVEIVGAGERGWGAGWLVRDPKRVLVDRSGPSRVQAREPSEGRLAYTTGGRLAWPGAYSVLFHAPGYPWVRPKCVYVRPDGRPMVEDTAPNTNCGAR